MLSRYKVFSIVDIIYLTLIVYFFTVLPCILILSKYFIYQLMHNRVALKEY